jgi:hypothetical protein
VSSPRFQARTLIPVAVVICSLAAAASIYHTIHKFQDIPFSWDAAAYATDGLIIAGDLKAGDMVSFIGDTYRQGWWPFVHSWLLAPAFILFGPSHASARAVSLLCFVLFLAVIYRLGVEMSPSHGHWIGLITVALSLSSLPFLVYSAMCMEEIPGLLMTFATYLFFLVALRTRKPGWFIWTGLFMAATLFTKWHHGVFVILAVSLTQISVEKKVLSRSNLSLFVPFSVIMFGWFAYPRHIFSFWGHSTFQPKYYKLASLENWLYYPKSFVLVYHASWIIALVAAAGFFYSLRYLKDPRVRLLAFSVLVGVAIMTIKLDKRHRYIIPIIPSIWLLGSGQIVEFIGRLKSRLRNRKLKVGLAAAGILGLLSIALLTIPKLYRQYPDSLQKYELYGDDRPNEAYEFISSHASGYDKIAVFSSWDYYNSLKGSNIRWNIEVKRCRDRQAALSRKRMGSSLFAELLKKRNQEAYNNLINFLENKDVRVYEYHLLSFMKMISEDAYRNFINRVKINPFSDRLTDVRFLAEDIRCLITIARDGEEDLNSYAAAFMKDAESWGEIAHRSFSGLGVTVTVYQRGA